MAERATRHGPVGTRSVMRRPGDCGGKRSSGGVVFDPAGPHWGRAARLLLRHAGEVLAIPSWARLRAATPKRPCVDHQQTETAGYERSTDDCRRRVARSDCIDPERHAEDRETDVEPGGSDDLGRMVPQRALPPSDRYAISIGEVRLQPPRTGPAPPLSSVSSETPTASPNRTQRYHHG
jgi:hypothetical protein